MNDCLFCKIINKKISANVIYEDNKILAFLDIAPVNKGHTLVIPKTHSNDFLSTNEEILQHLISKTKKIANAIIKATNCSGVNIVTNNGETAGQVIFHLHFHIIPRFESDNLPLWPKKEYLENEKENLQKNIIQFLN